MMFTRIAAALGLLAVVLGAFGAHALKSRIDADLMVVYQTGVQYHLVHALGIIIIGVLIHMLPAAKWLPAAGWTMTAGVVIFSGSLYLLSITGIRLLGAVTPIGGIALLAAWLLVAIGVANAG